MEASQVNLLEYLRSKTQVDLDTFDIEVARKIGQCIDCTSNQYEYYTEMAKESRKELLQKATELATANHGQYPTVTLEELAVEFAAVLMAVEIRPYVSGDIHVMVNPTYSYSKAKIIETGKRIHQLFKTVDPSFQRSRLILKVPATWEGLQACRELRYCSIKTLATTLFTMEQAVLAGEAGCVSISPFIHELKAMFEQTYRDKDPLLELCVQAQKWYQQESLPTKIKACATAGLDELLQLAGVDALTIMPDDLEALGSGVRAESELSCMSMFQGETAVQGKLEYPSYIDDEVKYRMDFDRVEDGRAQLKLGQAINIFCDFQTKAEEMVRVARAGQA